MFKKRGPQLLHNPDPESIRLVYENYRGLKPPILISFFDRYSHLENLISSLGRCRNICGHDIFIVQDAHSWGNHDENKQNRLRKYIASQENDLNIIFVERSANLGVGRNLREFTAAAIEVADACINLEDDMEVAPGFIDFVSQGIEHAVNKRNSIFGVTGYLPPILDETSMNVSPILVDRYSAWGVGHIAHHWKRVAWPTVNDFRLLKDSYAETVNEKFGHDCWTMLRGSCFGLLDAGDVAIWVYCIKNNLKVISPSHALARNNGLDGSGTHCVRTDVFDIDNLGSYERFDWLEVEYSQPTVDRCVNFRNKGIPLPFANKMIGGFV